MVGLSETAEFFVTFHHNWFDHSDSRHPRIRVASVHIYNNFYDGISKYGVGVTTGASAFVEANYFRHAKYPMMSSLQGTDALGNGTFSGENGGVIKAYNNIIVDADSLIYANSNSGTTSAHAASFDAYLASSRNESVPSSYKALKGGTSYNNFDTRIDLGVSSSNIDSVNAVGQIVTAKAGRLDGGDFDWQFNDAVDDTSYAMNIALMNEIRSYTSQLVSVGGNSSASPGPEPEPEPNPGPGPIAGEYAHNFTTAGTGSEFFNIQGNLSTSKGTVVYKGLTLTQCLKIETATRIEFTTAEASTLTLVFNQESGKKIKIDGTNYTLADGVVSVPLAPGAHTITKADSINLYYMELQ